MGVVGVIAENEAPPLLGLISQIAPIIVSGNSVVAFAPEAAPLPAILLGEMLAVSDLPGGVVNLLTGRRADLLPTFATHQALRAVDAAGVSEAERKTLALGAGRVGQTLESAGRWRGGLVLCGLAGRRGNRGIHRVQDDLASDRGITHLQRGKGLAQSPQGRRGRWGNF